MQYHITSLYTLMQYFSIYVDIWCQHICKNTSAFHLSVHECIYRWVPLRPDFLGAWKSVRLKHYSACPIIIINLIIQRNLATKIRAKRESSLTGVWLKWDPPVYMSLLQIDWELPKPCWQSSASTKRSSGPRLFGTPIFMSWASYLDGHPGKEIDKNWGHITKTTWLQWNSKLNTWSSLYV